MTGKNHGRFTLTALFFAAGVFLTTLAGILWIVDGL